MKHCYYIMVWFLCSPCFTHHASSCCLWNNHRGSTSTRTQPESSSLNKVTASRPEEGKPFSDKETSAIDRKASTKNQTLSIDLDTVVASEKPTLVTVITNDKKAAITIRLTHTGSQEQPTPDKVCQEAERDSPFQRFIYLWNHLPQGACIESVSITTSPARTTYDTQVTTTTTLTRTDNIPAAGKHVITFMTEQELPEENATYFGTKQRQTTTWEIHANTPSIPAEMLVTRSTGAAGIAAVSKLRYFVGEV